MIVSILRTATFIFFLFFSYLSFATDPDSISVLVVDENDIPVGGVKVSIQGQSTFTSKSDGTYKLITTKKLILPLSASIEKKGYEIDELNHFNSEIEIRIRKVQTKDKSLQLTLLGPDNKPINGLKVNYSKRDYLCDSKGNINISEKSFNEKLLSVPGFKIGQVKSEKNLYTILLKAEIATQPLVEKTESNVHVKSNLTVQPADNNQEVKDQTVDKNDAVHSAQVETQVVKNDVIDAKVSEEVFKQYQKDFDNLSQEVVKERERLLESNRKITAEIERATKRLREEKNLTLAQREELKKNIEKLEGELVQNSIEYNKADQKTMQLITNLKLVVMKKDSINAATMKQLKIEQKKVVMSEKKNRRTIIIFTIISFSLVLLAVVFYSIARKMKNHKIELMKVTEELSNLKKELAELN